MKNEWLRDRIYSKSIRNDTKRDKRFLRCIFEIKKIIKFVKFKKIFRWEEKRKYANGNVIVFKN